MTTALAQIEDEGRALVARAAASLPAKVLARRTGLTERHICGLRKGEHMPGGVALIALAQQVPELRQAVARWLGLAPGPESAALRAEIEAVLARHPEAGDQAGG